MATASLLEAVAVLKEPPVLRLHPLRSHPLFPTRLPLYPLRTLRPIRICPQSPTAIPRPPSTPPPSDDETNPLEALRKPAAAAMLLGFLLAADPSSVALAASGGRMGGARFSSSRSSSSSSSSSPSYSKSYSIPSIGSTYDCATHSGESYTCSVAECPHHRPPTMMEDLGFTVSVALAFIVFQCFCGGFGDEEGALVTKPGLTIHKIQVGLLGIAQSFQKDLDRIAETADTSTSAGLHYVLTETSLALLRHPDCWNSAYSSVEVKKSVEDGEKWFNQLSLEERGKLDEETLVNVNNVKKQKSTGQRSKGFQNEYIVITILVAVEGAHKLPIISSSADLKEALEKLGSTPSNKTIAVEVLWTPQDENDTLTEQELLEDYPLLRPL